MHKVTPYIFHLVFIVCLFPSLQIKAQDTIFERVDTLTSITSSHFDEINQGISIDERKTPDSVVAKLHKDDAFWYANLTPEKEKPSDAKLSTPFWQMQWFRTLLWFLIVGSFVAIIIWFLASSNIGLFRRKPTTIGEEMQEVHLSENIFDINYEKEIGNAISSENYNLAIRLHYLQLLKLLSQKELIHYSQEKTNSDYASQLYNTGFYKDFFRLTRQFEYSWYGQFPVNESTFQFIAVDFNTFKQRLR